MDNLISQGAFAANILKQLATDNGGYAEQMQSVQNTNHLHQCDTPIYNESKPGAIIGTCFEIIRPYFNISQRDLILNAKDIFLPIKTRTRLLDLYLPSVSISTFILLSTINRIISDKSIANNPAEILAKVSTWITFILLIEVFLFKFVFFIFKVQTNTMIIPHVEANASNSYNQTGGYEYGKNPVLVQLDGVPVLTLISVSGYKFIVLSVLLSLSLLFSEKFSFLIKLFKFYAYLAVSFNTLRCLEGLHLTTFTHAPTWEAEQPNLSHIYLLIYIASAMQFPISWALMLK